MSYMFKARVWVHEFDPPEIQEVWDDELTPIEGGKRPIRDWVKEHLENWCREEYVGTCEIPEDGTHEVLFSGTIRGWYDSYTGEYDEEIDVTESKTQRLPDEWFQDNSNGST
jgi:hypothetical protein